MVDIYKNYEATKTCKAYEKFCTTFPNQCCFNFNKTNPNRCGGSPCLPWSEDFMTWDRPGLLRHHVFMIIQFCVMFSIVLLFEAGIFRKLSYKLNGLIKRNKSNANYSQIEEEKMYDDLPKDSDVIEEENRIARLSTKLKFQSDIELSYEKKSTKKSANSEIFIVDSLTKYFDSFMAVKGTSFGLSNAECFGLLGIIFTKLIKQYG